MARIKAIFITCAIFVAFSIPASGAFASEFSADVNQQFGNMIMKGKFYMQGDKMRNEMEMMGTTRATIIRKDKGVVWILIPQRIKYMEMPLDEGAKNNPQFYQDKLEEMAKKESQGTEKISGYKCEKALYTFTDTSRGTMTQWYSKKLNFPLKMIWKGPNWEMTTEYSNIKTGNVDKALFELPEGYTKTEMPAGAPGMMQPGMGGSPHGMKK